MSDDDAADVQTLYPFGNLADAKLRARLLSRPRPPA